jgi:glucosamine-6-phosphate deaminase
VVQQVFSSPAELARAAADEASILLRNAIDERGKARFVAATGRSQIDFLSVLTADRRIDWSRVELFHLDEYIGLGPDHPASFQRYVRERVILPTGIRCAYLLNGAEDPAAVCEEAGAAISSAPVDLLMAGIGENGHLAFNDPPADFETDEPFIVVELDARNRSQQVCEGWFQVPEDVPRRAITMSIRQILKARAILCLAPGAHKAEAVRACLCGEIGPMNPASALRLHPRATLYLDRDSAPPACSSTVQCSPKPFESGMTGAFSKGLKTAFRSVWRAFPRFCAYTVG